jgi:hypothetical protein
MLHLGSLVLLYQVTNVSFSLFNHFPTIVTVKIHLAIFFALLLGKIRGMVLHGPLSESGL